MTEGEPQVTVRVIEPRSSITDLEHVDLQIDEEARKVVMTFNEETFREFQENFGKKITEGSHLELKLRDPR